MSGSGFVEAGVFGWSSGWLGGVVTLTNGATATFSGTADKWFGDSAELRNYGTITWTGGKLQGNTHYGPATIRNQANAVFHLAADGTPFTRYYGSHPFHFMNAPGAVLRKSSAGTVTLSSLWLNQQGELRVEAGTMDLNTTATLADGGRFTGAGLIRQTGETVTLAGLVTIEGSSFQLQAGTFAAGAGGAHRHRQQRILGMDRRLGEWRAGVDERGRRTNFQQRRQDPGRRRGDSQLRRADLDRRNGAGLLPLQHGHDSQSRLGPAGDRRQRASESFLRELRRLPGQ